MPDCENIALHYADKCEKLQTEIEKLKAIGEKYAKASEFYDNFIEHKFLKMRAETKKLVNQIGKEILQALSESKKGK